MSSKFCPTDQPSSEPSFPTTMNWWTKRQVCIAGGVWDMLGILKRVFHFRQIPFLCTAQPHQPPHLSRSAYLNCACCLCDWDISFLTKFYHHCKRLCQISGFIVYLQAALRRQTVSWLWWPPVSTTSVSTVWYPTAHCTGSTPRNPLWPIRYLMLVIFPWGVFLWLSKIWCWIADHVTSRVLHPGGR